MNYYEHHIGDYDSATAHLSMLEDAAYRRLICFCYRTEAPIPADPKQAFRLVRAITKPERDAVQQVLSEFFELEADGWHNPRCDAEIARYIDGEPEREVKKANENNRMRKHREERASLFKVLTDAGKHAPWNIGMSELRVLVGRMAETPPATLPETPPLPLPATPPATAPATPATATQTPSPIPSTKDQEISLLAQAPALPAEDRPPADLAEAAVAKAKGPLDCPHLDVLALWAVTLPHLPQHLPSQWRGARADHLRARWRETAVEKGWTTQQQGLAYLEKLFTYVGRSRFLTGNAKPRDGGRPFVVELEWLVNPANWAKVHEGKYHPEAA